jgi:glycopeptide antibiotics resistance protein
LAASGRQAPSPGAIARPTLNLNRRNAAIQNPLPWLIPGTLAFAIIGVMLATPLSRVLRTHRIVAWLLVVGAAIVIFATLAPLYGVFEPSATGPGRCDMSNLSMIPLADLATRSDRTLNVILFIPVGIAIGLLPRSHWKALLVLTAIASPFLIEATQLLVPALNRGCQGIDVIDNLTGMTIGMGLGALVGALWKRLARGAATTQGPQGRLRRTEAAPDDLDGQAR